jgi:hypothetical protein
VKPDEDKPQLLTHLLEQWAVNPPSWAGTILQALKRAPIGGLDLDVWGELPGKLSR